MRTFPLPAFGATGSIHQQFKTYIFILFIHIGTTLDQQFNNIFMSLPCCNVQWCPSLINNTDETNGTKWAEWDIQTRTATPKHCRFYHDFIRCNSSNWHPHPEWSISWLVPNHHPWRLAKYLCFWVVLLWWKTKTCFSILGVLCFVFDDIGVSADSGISRNNINLLGKLRKRHF